MGTVTTDPNHKYLMKNCPMTCAMYRGEACPVPYVPPPYVPAWSTRKEDTPFPGNCTRPKSIGQCGACLTGAQCKTGFCCPFLKLCVPNSKTGCHWKFMASCGVNKNGRGHRDNIMDDSFTITGIFTGPNIKYGLETGLQYGDEFECNAACKAFKAKSRV